MYGGGYAGWGGGGVRRSEGSAPYDRSARDDTRVVQGKVFLGGLPPHSTKESVSEYASQWQVVGLGSAPMLMRWPVWWLASTARARAQPLPGPL